MLLSTEALLILNYTAAWLTVELFLGVIVNSFKFFILNRILFASKSFTYGMSKRLRICFFKAFSKIQQNCDFTSLDLFFLIDHLSACPARRLLDMNLMQCCAASLFTSKEISLFF